MTRYYTNFEQGHIGDPPSLFTLRWKGVSEPTNHVALVRYGTPSVKRREVRYYQAAASDPGMTSYDPVDIDGNRKNVEVLTLVKPDSPAATDFHIDVRGSGVTASANFYRCALSYSGSAGANTLNIIKSVAGTVTSLASPAFTPSSSVYTFVRFRVQDNGASVTLQAKAWAVGTTEPSSWTATATDSSLNGQSGWIGFCWFAQSGNAAGLVNFFSVATNGDTAWMPKTNAEFKAWLDAPNRRRVLADITATGYDSSGSPYTKTVNAYIANGGFNTQSFDTPASTHYSQAIASVPTFKRQMSTALSGKAASSFGTLSVANPAASIAGAGARDDWLRAKWKRDPLKLYLGDESWPKHDFRIILYGTLGQPTAPKSADRIEFEIFDLLKKLDLPIGRDKYDSSAPYPGRYVPMLIGPVTGVEPTPTDTSTLEMQVSDVALDSLPDVYDDYIPLRGVLLLASLTVDPSTDTFTYAFAHGMLPGYRIKTNGTPPAGLSALTEYFVIASGLNKNDFKLSATLGGSAVNITGSTIGAGFWDVYGWTNDLAHGKFTLAASPAGRILTGNVTPSGAAGTLADAISNAVFTRYGLSTDFKDSASFAAAPATFNVGKTYFDEAVTALKVMDDFCSGSNSWYGFSFDGLLQIGQIGLPSATAVLTLTQSQVRGVKLSSRIPPVDRATLAVRCAQLQLQNGPINVPPSLPATVATPLGPVYYTVNGDAWSAPGTPLDDHPDQSDVASMPLIDSVFTLAADGVNEVTRLETLFAKTLGIFEFQAKLGAIYRDDGTPVCLGDTLDLTHPRLGWKIFNSGDPASPDDTATHDAKKAVILGMDINLSAEDEFKVTYTVIRQIPGYYPTGDLT